MSAVFSRFLGFGVYARDLEPTQAAKASDDDDDDDDEEEAFVQPQAVPIEANQKSGERLPPSPICCVALGWWVKEFARDI